MCTGIKISIFIFILTAVTYLNQTFNWNWETWANSNLVGGLIIGLFVWYAISSIEDRAALRWRKEFFEKERSQYQLNTIASAVNCCAYINAQLTDCQLEETYVAFDELSMQNFQELCNNCSKLALFEKNDKEFQDFINSLLIPLRIMNHIVDNTLNTIKEYESFHSSKLDGILYKENQNYMISYQKLVDIIRLPDEMKEYYEDSFFKLIKDIYEKTAQLHKKLTDEIPA